MAAVHMRLVKIRFRGSERSNMDNTFEEQYVAYSLTWSKIDIKHQDSRGKKHKFSEGIQRWKFQYIGWMVETCTRKVSGANRDLSNCLVNSETAPVWTMNYLPTSAMRMCDFPSLVPVWIRHLWDRESFFILQDDEKKYRQIFPSDLCHICAYWPS